MPLLTLMGGADALAAGALGVGGHLDAKDKNEEAEKIVTVSDAVEQIKNALNN